MTSSGLWNEPMYKEAVLSVLAFLFIVSGLIFSLKKKSPKFLAAWASLKSWLITAPLIFIAVGLPEPWPLVALVLTAIYGSKTFFKMVGMYHRSWFIWTTYIFIISLGYYTHKTNSSAYDLIPMVFLASICLIPLLRNSAKSMVQYIALSLMAFVFFGWSFLYLGRILMLDQGIYILIYIYILAEFSESMNFAGTRLFGKLKPFSNISAKVSLEGVILSLALTLVLAWALRHLLPDRSEPFWIMSGLIATIFGRFGELIISVVRRDLGIKDAGVFIIGRDDIIARVDKLIFVAPLFYYSFLFLMENYSSL